MDNELTLNGFSRIGTCRKKVMGLLRLMGNKADVVKGLSKRCNENWSVAPKSDIVSAQPKLALSQMLTGGDGLHRDCTCPIFKIIFRRRRRI